MHYSNYKHLLTIANTICGIGLYSFVCSIPAVAQNTTSDSFNWGTSPSTQNPVSIQSERASLISQRPSLGVTGHPTTVKIIIEGSQKIIPGEGIKNVDPNSTADRAGLQPGDIVVKWNGAYVGYDGELPMLIRKSKGFGPFEAKIVRNGYFKVLTVNFNKPTIIPKSSPKPALIESEPTNDPSEEDLRELLAD